MLNTFGQFWANIIILLDLLYIGWSNAEYYSGYFLFLDSQIPSRLKHYVSLQSTSFEGCGLSCMRRNHSCLSVVFDSNNSTCHVTCHTGFLGFNPRPGLSTLLINNPDLNSREILYFSMPNGLKIGTSVFVYGYNFKMEPRFWPMINLEDRTRKTKVFHMSFRETGVVFNTLYNNQWGSEIVGPSRKTLPKYENFVFQIHFTGSNFKLYGNGNYITSLPYRKTNVQLNDVVWVNIEKMEVHKVCIL